MPKIISSAATMLGLYLHSPLAFISPNCNPGIASPPPPVLFAQTESEQAKKAIRNMEKRVRDCLPLQLSFKDRTMYLSFYVLSLPHYHHSILTPSPALLQKYYSLIRKLLCPRHWIQVQHLPGIVTYLKLGILHCPSISLFSSLLGFAIRCFGEPVVLWLCSITAQLPPLPIQIRNGLLTIRDQLTSADPFNPEPFSELFQRHLFQHLSSYKLSRLITQHFQHHLRRKLFTLDRKFLLKRYAQVPWHLSPSPHHFDALHRTSLKVVPASCRLATLRWSIDSEPDAHFRLRRFLSRRSPCRCGCGIISAFYPDGISNGSLAPTHLTPAISWRLHLPPALPPMFSHLSNLPAHPPLPAATHTTWTSREGHSIASLSLILPPSEQAWAHHPCVLCGAGDNSVQHWLLFCPVPAMAGSLLLKTPWKSQTWYLSPLLPLNKLCHPAGSP